MQPHGNTTFYFLTTFVDALNSAFTPSTFFITPLALLGSRSSFISSATPCKFHFLTACYLVATFAFFFLFHHHNCSLNVLDFPFSPSLFTSLILSPRHFIILTLYSVSVCCINKCYFIHQIYMHHPLRFPSIKLNIF